MGADTSGGNTFVRPGSGPRVTRGQIWSIVGGTGLVLAVALALVLIVTSVVVSMRQTANRIDDERAMAAASAAIGALQRRLSLTVQDNAVWDEAYNAALGSEAGVWIRDNWGAPSAAYPLYDGVVVLATDLSLIASYIKGAEFTPSGAAGRMIAQQAARAQASDRPVASLLRIGDMVVAFAAMTMKPFSVEPTNGEMPVLILMKAIDENVLELISRDYQIVSLGIDGTRMSDMLNLELKDPNGERIGYLFWPSRKPGDKVFEQNRPLLLVAGATLVVFLLLVLAAGAVETTRLRRIAAAAELEAKRDPLSGALNRGGFLETLDTLAKEVSPESPLTLHMLDLDGFKKVNDTYGHAVGDLLISAVAVRLAGFADQFTAIGRLGGDEFALAQVQAQPPQILAQQVIDALSIPFIVGEREFHVSASIGHATSLDGGDPAELMRRADVAMYAAKAAGKCRALQYVSGMEDLRRPADVRG